VLWWQKIKNAEDAMQAQNGDNKNNTVVSKHVERNVRRNEGLFRVGVTTSILIAFLFTLAFFREQIDIFDIPMEVVLGALAIIGAYTGHNRAMQAQDQCIEGKRGDVVFICLLVWGGIMFTLYMLRFFHVYFGFDIVVPQNFYLFFEGLILIYIGSSAFDLFVGIKRSNGTNGTIPPPPTS
jgi:high-affinity Fe2+/Pb2+ permease